MEADLDALVRRADEDRWLAAQLAPPAVRDRLIALIALYQDIAKAAEIVSEPTLGAIRVQFWRDAIGGLHDGRRAVHPALAMLTADDLPRDATERLLDARLLDFEPQPFATGADRARYVEDTAGVLIALAARICGAPMTDDLAAALGRAWGLAGLARATPFWAERGRDLRPVSDDRAIVDEVRDAMTFARPHVRALPSEATPAFAYVSLAPAYAAGRTPGPLAKRARILWMALTGSI